MLPFNPQLHVIHLPKRTDRRERFEQEFAEQGVNYRLWDGIENKKKPAEGINAAHRQIVQYAKDNDLSNILIAEDDIIFSAPKAWEYFLRQLPAPNSYDLFFGMIYSAEIKENRIVNGMSGLTLYSVSHLFYDFFLSIPYHAHIDRYLGQFAFEKKYFVCNPMVALQTGGFSDNLKREMHYRPFLESKEFFGQPGKVFDRGVWHDKK